METMLQGLVIIGGLTVERYVRSGGRSADSVAAWADHDGTSTLYNVIDITLLHGNIEIMEGITPWQIQRRKLH
jgi:hypothetical protein